MYHMKNIISVTEQIILPKCMYHVKNTITSGDSPEMEINIRDQVMKFLKESPNKQIMELEARQDKLLVKLDHLYEKIKNISTICNLSEAKVKLNNEKKILKIEDAFSLPLQEIVLTLNADSLPWLLNIFLKKSGDINLTWHIHSSINKEKVPKILAFFKSFQELYKNKQDSKTYIRLIFKNAASVPELRLTPLDIPIVGTSNILRYLCFKFHHLVAYNFNDYKVDALLDLCYLLERAPAKNKDDILKNVFTNNKQWVYDDQFTIADLAFYSVTKQQQSLVNYVPKQWFENCEKMIL